MVFLCICFCINYVFICSFGLFLKDFFINIWGVDLPRDDGIDAYKNKNKMLE